MANPWDEIPKPADLPDPELNPLMNPTLGKNLGRWAQVYFTSPPENRAQAVEELLRELEGGTARVDISNPDASAREGGEPRDTAGVLCPRCHEPSSGEHKFCGICGTPLAAIPEPAAHVTSQAAPTFAGYSETTAPPAGEDVQWLRDRSLTEFEPEASSHKTWIFAGAALVIVLGAAAYLQWSASVRSSSSAVATSPVAPDSAVTAPSQPPMDASPQPSTPNEATPNAQRVVEAMPKVNLIPESDRVALAGKEISREATPPDAAAESGPANGSRELAEAQRLLDGKSSPRNPEVAARLLWKAVGKENAGAELALADLYARGDGVGKNCEQARLLLVAATKKGVGDAAQKLRSLESSGCQ